MATDINQLNDSWIAQGQKVSDLNDKLNAAVLDDKFDAEKFKDMKTERDNAVARRDALHDQLEEARNALESGGQDSNLVVTPVADANGHKHFAAGIRKLLKGQVKRLNLVTTSSTTGSNAGLTIPEDVQTRINTLIREFDVLQPLVNVEKVSTESGSRVIELFSKMDALVELDDEDAAIPDSDEPSLKTVSYKIKRYGGINKATNSLIKDSDENIITWLVKWIAKKVVVTRNQKILAVFDTTSKKPTIAKWDDIIDLADGTLDPAISNLSVFVTNVSGWTTLKKVKNAMGDYMIQRDPQGNVPKVIDDKQVVVVSDNWLPDTAKGVHPLYYGYLNAAVTLFDLENMSLATTTEGGDAFAKDQTWIRVIDRFDTEAVDDGAMAAGSFSTIADQTANFAASSVSGTTDTDTK
ncbi:MULTISPECIES: phage major capsid protein [unclassified Levilactobacillus]|uniref:phage major capsid protein n=1 Tax=unclassified Levilactobacillus TaxID=2767918 RepID=UPI002FF2B3E3